MGEAPGLLGAVLLALVSGIEFNVSCRSRVADNAGEPDLGAFEGDAGVNARPEGTWDRCARSRSVEWSG